MSLLLLFPSNAPVGWIVITGNQSSWAVRSDTPTSWANTADSSTGWLVGNYDYKNVWSEWATTTWGVMSSSGLNWGSLAGYTFVNTASNSTVWIVST